MKTTPVAANGFQLTRLGFVNCYLVREADGFSLIDTGLPGSAEDILAAARQLGAPIRRVVAFYATRSMPSVMTHAGVMGPGRASRPGTTEVGEAAYRSAPYGCASGACSTALHAAGICASVIGGRGFGGSFGGFGCSTPSLNQ